MPEVIKVYLPSETGETNLQLFLSVDGVFLDVAGNALTEVANGHFTGTTVNDRTADVVYDALVRVDGGRLIMQAYLWPNENRLGLPPAGAVAQGGGTFFVRTN